MKNARKDQERKNKKKEEKCPWLSLKRNIVCSHSRTEGLIVRYSDAVLQKDQLTSLLPLILGSRAPREADC